MMPFRFGLLFLALSVCLSGSPAIAVEGSPVQERGSVSDRESVRATIERWRTAIVQGDRAALVEVYHPDLAYGHAYGAVLTRTEQIDTTIKPGRVFTAVDVENLAVRVYGDVAYVTATWTFHLRRDDGATSNARLSGLDAWVREDGKWRMLARQLTRPTAPPAS